MMFFLVAKGCKFDFCIGFLGVSKGQLLKLQKFICHSQWLKLSPLRYWWDNSLVWISVSAHQGRSSKAIRGFLGYLPGSGRKIPKNWHQNLFYRGMLKCEVAFSWLPGIAQSACNTTFGWGMISQSKKIRVWLSRIWQMMKDNWLGNSDEWGDNSNMTILFCNWIFYVYSIPFNIHVTAKFNAWN